MLMVAVLHSAGFRPANTLSVAGDDILTRWVCQRYLSYLSHSHHSCLAISASDSALRSTFCANENLGRQGNRAPTSSETIRRELDRPHE